jgi:membrane protease YdiL (CAAX protease family)
VSVITAFGAALLALSEEFFFRGCLLGWLEQHVSRVVALIAVTLFFAICHFLGGAKSPSVDEISWLSGFQMLSQYAGRLAADAHWVPQFLMLALVGLTLGWCRLQTSTLYLSIGLHAGWVFSGKMLFVVTNINRATPNWWFGHGKLLGSPISIAAVGSVLVLMVWVGKRLRARDVVHSAPLAGASEA